MLTATEPMRQMMIPCRGHSALDGGKWSSSRSRPPYPLKQGPIIHLQGTD
jgi:hypothetical protein